jgi:predicted metal-dependent phosphoesterase TrpH
MTRADLHCHSTASAVAKLGVQHALGLPECATPPDEVYALAKRRGMDFVTITDHDTIDGALAIAGRMSLPARRVSSRSGIGTSRRHSCRRGGGDPR